MNDPIIQFGKHRGSTLSNLPIDYTQWMASLLGTANEIVNRGTNWSRLAANELARRGQPISSAKADLSNLDPKNNPALQDHNGNPGIEVEEVVSPVMTKPLGDMEHTYSEEAINDAVNCLMKDFLVRTDRTIPFMKWLRLFVLEEVLSKNTMIDQVSSSVMTYRCKRIQVTYNSFYYRVESIFKCGN